MCILVAQASNVTLIHTSLRALLELHKIPGKNLDGCYNNNPLFLLSQQQLPFSFDSGAATCLIGFQNTTTIMQSRAFSRSIPKIIHQVWLEHPGIDQVWQTCVPRMQTCQEMYQKAGWRYQRWTNADISRYISSLCVCD